MRQNHETQSVQTDEIGLTPRLELSPRKYQKEQIDELNRLRLTDYKQKKRIEELNKSTCSKDQLIIDLQKENEILK